MFDDEVEQYIKGALVVRKGQRVYHASRNHQRDVERRAKSVQTTINELLDRIIRLVCVLNWIAGHSDTEGEILRRGLQHSDEVLSGLDAGIRRLANKLDRMSPESGPSFLNYYEVSLAAACDAVKEGVRITLDDDDDGQALRAAVAEHTNVIRYKSHVLDIIELRNSRKRKGPKKQEMTEVERFILLETGKLRDSGLSWDAVREYFVNTVYEVEVSRQAVWLVARSGQRYLEKLHNRFSGFIHV